VTGRAENEALKTELTAADLRGICATCQRAASDCVSETGKFKCLGWVKDERKLAEILEVDTSGTM
jgi:hypothetical protein